VLVGELRQHLAHGVGGAVEALVEQMRADEADYAKNEVVPLAEVPKDLIQYLYTENVFAAKVKEPTVEKVDPGSLPDVDGAVVAAEIDSAVVFLSASAGREEYDAASGAGAALVRKDEGIDALVRAVRAAAGR
jgi:hypothetical protein